MGTGHGVSRNESSTFEHGVVSRPPSSGAASAPKLTEATLSGYAGDAVRENTAPVSGLTTAEVLLRGMRVGGVSALPVGSFPLHLLIVESDEPLRQPLLEIGRQMGFAVRGCAPREVVSALRTLQCDVVLLDLSPEATKLDVLRKLRQAFPRVPILVTTAFASVQTAVDALRHGASDFLTKPFSLEELTTTLSLAAEQRSFDVELRRVQHQMRTSPALQETAAASPGMQKLLSMVTRVALSQHPVMVLGESGSGKERVARMLHGAAQAAAAERATGDGAGASAPPFLQVACSTSGAAMLETELFGYVRNEGTALREERVGLLTVEGGGTLFLDEIDGLPLELQSKLLRALQERSVRPAGGAMTRPVTVRLVASSSRDLPALVERGAFRKDLYFRLNVVNLRVPPLRQRREDVPLLAAVFLERHSRERQLSFSLGPDAMRVLLEYAWPGNVRELEAAIERACTLSSGPVLHLVDLPTQLQQGPAEEQALRFDGRHGRAEADEVRARVPAEASTIESIAEMERRMILLTLEKLKGDKIMAAKVLGIGKTTLYRKLKEYGIGELAA